MEKRYFNSNDLNNTITPQQYIDKYIPNDSNLFVMTCSELSNEISDLYDGDLTDYPIDEVDYINELIKDDCNTFDGYVIVCDGRDRRFFEILN